LSTPQSAYEAAREYRYNMSHPRRGIALIFNNVKFDKYPPRTGSENDAAEMEKTLKDLSFEVLMHEHCSVDDMRAVMESAGTLE
jgi:hypothetical protein